MSNIEEDIKILIEENTSNKKEQAIEHILAERKQDKERIKELEEHLKKFYNGELYTAKQLKQIGENQNKYFIPVQKVKDILKELNQEYIKIDKSIDIYKKSDDRGKVDCLQMISWLEGKLEELLEDK